MAVTTKLSVWNAALRELGAAPLANTTDANTRQYELAAAWDHAIEHVLAMQDWNFARRRANLSGVSDSSYPPYTFRFTRPANYLRKVWFKTSAADEYQIDHAEPGAAIYAAVASGLLEYISEHADNLDPANWPPHFTRVMTLYLAGAVAPKLARAGAGDQGALAGKLETALGEATEKEAIFLLDGQIPVARQPVFRRALEFMGQQLSGSVAIHAHTDMLRWHMNRAWDHALRFVLEQGAWNYATRRATLTGGTEPVPGAVSASIVEGYSVAPATEPAAAADLPDMAGFDYGFPLPADFLHKIWIKADANHTFECRHQIMGGAIYTNVAPVVTEYIAWDADSRDPAQWSASFLEAVAAYLALVTVPELLLVAEREGVKVAANDVRQKLETVYEMKLSNAKLRDAIQQEPKQLPPGRFVRARMGGTVSNRRY